jgi:hypothetical protein
MPEVLEQVFALYRETFPENERRPESDLRAALRSQQYQLLTTHRDETLAGFAIIFVPTGAAFALLARLSHIRKNRGHFADLICDFASPSPMLPRKSVWWRPTPLKSLQPKCDNAGHVSAAEQTPEERQDASILHCR